MLFTLGSLNRNTVMANPARILTTLVRLPANESLNAVNIVRGFLTPSECKQVVEVGRSGLDVGDMTEPPPGGLQCASLQWIFPGAESEWFFAKLETALADINKGYRFDLKGFFQGARVATLADGGVFDWHTDLGPGQNSTRKLSVLVQLNDPRDYDGGELEYRVADASGADDIGALTVFPSYLEYRLRPVTRGERVVLLSWISGPAFK